MFNSLRYRVELGAQIVGDHIRNLGHVASHKILDEPPEIIDNAFSRIKEAAACVIDTVLHATVEKGCDDEIQNKPKNLKGE